MNTREQIYETALNNFTKKISQSKKIIAVVLYGSMVTGELWDESDIDLLVITSDEKEMERDLIFYEDDIEISAFFVPRGKFRKIVESNQRSDVFNSILKNYRIIFSVDPMLGEYMDEMAQIGEYDLSLKLFQSTCEILLNIEKAKKAVFHEKDYHSASIYIIYIFQWLGNIEVLGSGEPLHRNNMSTAMKLNPQLFKETYDTFYRHLEDETLYAKTLEQIEDYLYEHIKELFGPIFDILTDEFAVYGITQILQQLRRNMEISIFHVSAACEWLYRRQILQRDYNLVSISGTGKKNLEEAAYVRG